MHLDTVLTFCDRAVVASYTTVVAAALGGELRTVPIGADQCRPVVTGTVPSVSGGTTTT